MIIGKGFKMSFGMTAVIMTALLIFEIIEGPEKKTSNESVKVENLVIDIPEPCSIGTISVVKNGKKEQLYYGTINIANDGKDGEQIEIILDLE